MKYLITGLFCLAILSITAQNREISFKGADWKSQLATAKKENKIIFFDAYTSWCGPCKVMAKDVFTIDSVADLFNSTFHNVKYDMEKGEGPALAKEFQIQGYPTYLFIDADGVVIHKIVGSMSPTEFMTESRKALKPENTAYGLAKKFNAGDHSDATMLAYMDALEKAYESDKMGKVAKIYFDRLPQAALLDEGNWKLAVKYLNNPSSTAFAYLLAHQPELLNKYGQNEVNMYFMSTLFGSVYSIKRAYETKGDVDYAKELAASIRKLQAKPNADAIYMLSLLDIIEFAADNQWDKYVQKVETVLGDKSFTRREDFVITAANDLVTAAPSQFLKTAKKWADQIETLKPELFVQIQLADLNKRILSKQGRTEEAQVMGIKADELRKEAAEKGQMTPPIMRD